MKNTIIKAIILFVSIPLMNAIVFGIASSFHEMHQSSITAAQYESYGEAINLMIYASGLAVFIIEGMYDLSIVKNAIAVLLYILVFGIVGYMTSDQFVFRPYEHSLSFFSMVSVLITRIYLNKKLQAK